MKKIVFLAIAMVIALADSFAQSQYREVSGIYAGGHIRRGRPGTITKLRNSGFTYVILFNVNVEADGTLTTDGETICKNGEYVFAQTQPYYQEDIRNLKTEPTSVSRIEICIGGWGNGSYGNIKNLINSQEELQGPQASRARNRCRQQRPRAGLRSRPRCQIPYHDVQLGLQDDLCALYEL